MPKTILVVAAHPDDEVLGCGATVSKHVSQNDTVHLLTLTNGVGARLNYKEDQVLTRQRSLQKSCEILGFSNVNINDFPDNQLDTVPLIEVVRVVEESILRLKPDVIYTHFNGDLNIDHQLTCKAVITASRPTPDFHVKSVFGFEILSSTDWAMGISPTFVPTLYSDVTNFLSKKMDAVDQYSQELRSVPHSRSREHIEILASHRGSTVGVKYAEAFVIYRHIT